MTNFTEILFLYLFFVKWGQVQFEKKIKARL